MIQLSDIESALERIRADIRISPCTHSETFSGLTHNSIFLKLDNQQRTGAFKERGALNKLLTLSQAERARGVIAASAGNHAQGVAYHAGRHKIAARIVNGVHYAGANKAAWERIDPKIRANAAIYPPPDVLARCELIEDLGPTTQLLDELWTEVKAQ